MSILQSRGDILPALVKIERILAEAGVTRIVLDLSAHLHEQQPRLVKLNYSQSIPRLYSKEITYRKSVRFSITEKCNYHCFFCHEEGMEMEVGRSCRDLSDIFEVIRQFAEQGYDDFTFTGGEPLLQWRSLSACLDYMEQIGYQPEITIVTNGERITPKVIERLVDYPGKVRFNLSVHSLRDDEYLSIVHRKKKPDFGSDNLLTKIKQKIELIRQAGIPFKLNFVLLKGVNTSLKSLEAILEYSATCGASTVKFLELLITEGLKDFYPYFYSLQALEKDLSEVLTFSWQDHRRRVFKYKNTDLDVEIQHCTCARGCNTCSLNRDANFTAELNYFPCFLHPEHNFALDGGNLISCLEQGEKFVDNMASHYQDYSPILIKEAYTTRSERAYYYQILPQEQAAIVALSKARLHRIREFKEFYYSDGSSEFECFDKVQKLSLNSYDNSYFEIQQTISVAEQGMHETQFLTDGINITDAQRYNHALEQENKLNHLTLDWKIEYYRTDKGELSISQNAQTGIVLLRAEKPFELLNVKVKPVTVPVPLLIQQVIDKAGVL
ncbi:hypothetical protein ABT56_22095 [Photobacterium aquae]|uniref:Radical SAM core domain-containing protein n=1 Tax=Photobacterium aquae TaxID=1195763 RepID=A0A0J1JHP8_9GAMM|nr:hypothetical protein ABT56_22095 [Photobacterium aquae]